MNVAIQWCLANFIVISIYCEYSIVRFAIFSDNYLIGFVLPPSGAADMVCS